MSDSSGDVARERRFHIWGWVLFMICAGFFIASAVESGSVLGLTGSLIFLVACLLFLAPLVTFRYRDSNK